MHDWVYVLVGLVQAVHLVCGGIFLSQERFSHPKFRTVAERQAGWEHHCPVCEGELTYWSRADPYDITVLGCTCEHCHLIEMRKERRARCGFIWYKFDLGGWYPKDTIREAKRLHADSEEQNVRPDNPLDHTAWAVYADWLEEHSYPLNAAALRLTACKLMGTGDADNTFGPESDVPEGRPAVHPPAD